MKKDYYDVLGVARNASASDIKKAYRKLAKQYHPDSNEGDEYAATRFKEVNEAYDVLSDEKKKKMYDQFGDAAFDGTGGGYSGGNGYQSYHFNNSADMDDILKQFFGGGGGAGGFNQGFNQGFRQSPKKGADVQSQVKVSFDEAAFGSKKRIRFQKGTGEEVLEVNIPAGIADGKVIRLKGKGRPGKGGGPNGDILLKVLVQNKPGYKREGQDVYTTVRVPFTTAVLGGEAKMETIYGDVQCNVRPGTQSGSQIRLRGKGIVSMSDPNVHGDQYVTIEVDVPKNLSPEAIEKLKEFEKLC